MRVHNNNDSRHSLHRCCRENFHELHVCMEWPYVMRCEVRRLSYARMHVLYFCFISLSLLFFPPFLSSLVLSCLFVPAVRMCGDNSTVSVLPSNNTIKWFYTISNKLLASLITATCTCTHAYFYSLHRLSMADSFYALFWYRHELQTIGGQGEKN